MQPRIDVTNGQKNTTRVDDGIVVFAEVSLQSIPTVINGITASTSIIIGFIGVMIGLLYREVFFKEEKTRTLLLYVAFFMGIPLAYLSLVYNFLIIGWLDTALRMALAGLILSIFVFVLISLYVGFRMDEKEKKYKKLDNWIKQK